MACINGVLLSESTDSMYNFAPAPEFALSCTYANSPSAKSEIAGADNAVLLLI